ncbi:MAG: DUF4124 domain-containing protein [Pseudomonadota bacterium]
MRFMIGLFVIIFLSLPNFNSHADTIYSWTDQDGVRKFSNLSPEEDVEDFEVMGEIPLSQSGITVDAGNEADAGSEAVESAVEQPGDSAPVPEPESSTIELNEITKEIQAQVREEESSIQETASDNADTPFDAKVQMEKTRLQEEINRIEQLAVGKGLSLPRKNAMLKNLRDQLELLEKSPAEIDQ